MLPQAFSALGKILPSVPLERRHSRNLLWLASMNVISFLARGCQGPGVAPCRPSNFMTTLLDGLQQARGCLYRLFLKYALDPSPDNALFVVARISCLLASHCGGLDQQNLFPGGVEMVPASFSLGIEKGSPRRREVLRRPPSRFVPRFGAEDAVMRSTVAWVPC